MSDDLAGFWIHTVTIRPFEGSGAYGPVHGPPVEVTCFVEDIRRLVRSREGKEVVSETTVLAPTGTLLPPESTVLLPSGRTATVITVATHDSGGLDLPDHVEAALT